MIIFIFFFGAALGSFINVLAVRYDPEHFVFSPSIIGGRSHCPHCKKTLRWFELVPLLSFIFQLGRCRGCARRISFQYPLVEIAAGLICVFVPMRLHFLFLPSTFYLPLSILWIAVFLTLLLIVLIDTRLYLIPDEANVFIGVAGFAITAFMALYSHGATGSFLGEYAHLFGFPENAWANHVLAALAAGFLFALIIGVTRGKGMGMGDLKLVVPLGLAFGWPDIFLVIALGFVIGAIYGIYAIVSRNKNFKSAVPFGPFLALGAALVFFFGYDVIRAYAHLFGP